MIIIVPNLEGGIIFFKWTWYLIGTLFCPSPPNRWKAKLAYAGFEQRN